MQHNLSEQPYFQHFLPSSSPSIVLLLWKLLCYIFIPLLYIYPSHMTVQKACMYPPFLFFFLSTINFQLKISSFKIQMWKYGVTVREEKLWTTLPLPRRTARLETPGMNSWDGLNKSLVFSLKNTITWCIKSIQNNPKYLLADYGFTKSHLILLLSLMDSCYSLHF